MIPRALLSMAVHLLSTPSKMLGDGVRPDVMSYHQALRACALGARGDGRAAGEALGLIEDMGHKGLVPDAGTLEAFAR